MLPQFTTMNVIDGQAGLMSYSSLIFYSLTIDNILNIIVLLILASVSIATLTGQNGMITKSNEAKEETEIASLIEEVELARLAMITENNGDTTKRASELMYYLVDSGVLKEDRLTFKSMEI